MTDISKTKQQIAIYKQEIQNKMLEAGKKAIELDKIYEEIKEYQGVVSTLEIDLNEKRQGELF